jgi:AraC-like DNA-binding protein
MKGTYKHISIPEGIRVQPMILTRPDNAAGGCLDCYEILWIKEGRGHMIADLQERPLEPNTVHLLRPGQFRRLMPEDVCQGYYIHISRQFMHQEELHDISLQLQGHARFQLNAGLMDDTQQIICRLQKELLQHGTNRPAILSRYFELFLLYLLSDSEHDAAASNTEQALVQRFLDAVRRNFKSRKMVTDYAAELWVTPGHLNRTVKNVTGFPASYHIQQYIVLEAKRRARYSEMSMKEIAYDLGFDDASHFSKFFRNNSGMNFTEFRRHITAGHKAVA